MENYSKDFVNLIQTNINADKCIIKHFTSMTELPRVIYFNGVTIRLTETNGKRDVLRVNDFTFNNNDCIEWKKEPIGRFYIKDWKTSNNNDNGNLYAEINIALLGGNSVKAVIRNVDGVEEIEPELMIDGLPYIIIKAILTGIEQYSKKSSLENMVFTERMIVNYKYYGEDEDEETEDEEYENCCSTEANNMADDAPILVEELF